MLVDEAIDGVVQGAHAAMDAAADLLFRQIGKEALDPGLRRGRLWLIQEAKVGV